VISLGEPHNEEKNKCDEKRLKESKLNKLNKLITP
jgi:hypothetical protein